MGIHAHNNQQLAFANTIAACTYGASYLDATMNGMGRGAGNCHMESLLAFLNDPRYNLAPVMEFVENQMQSQRDQGYTWGYDIPYLLTGITNTHPLLAIRFLEEKRTDYSRFYQELLENI